MPRKPARPRPVPNCFSVCLIGGETEAQCDLVMDHPGNHLSNDTIVGKDGGDCVVQRITIVWRNDVR